jgi:hypothetical protein
MDKLSVPNNVFCLSTATSDWGSPVSHILSVSSPESPAKVSSPVALDPTDRCVTIVSSADVKSVQLILSAESDRRKSVVEQLNAQLSGTADWPILHPTD